MIGIAAAFLLIFGLKPVLTPGTIASTVAQSKELEPDGPGSSDREPQDTFFDGPPAAGKPSRARPGGHLMGADRQGGGDSALIGNHASKVYHLVGCPSLFAMKDENEVDFASADEAIDRGYLPCHRCILSENIRYRGDSSESVQDVVNPQRSLRILDRE